MRAQVVIGANYGDEGKGIFTDFLASENRDAGKPCVVVRFNGGANAGHTVDTGEFRHVFGHFGSGLFAGARTHLSQHFIVNPILFRKEWQEITAMTEPKRIFPLPNRVTMDPRAIVTHPYDMLMNQCLEEARGATRHGSCGVGINETVTRQAHCGFTVADLASSRSWQTFNGMTLGTRLILDYYDERAKLLGIRSDFAKKCRMQDWDLRFLQDWNFMRTRAMHQHDGYLKSFGEVIFEGAQGLGLDEINGKFPHVTRSRTGLTNVRDVCLEAGIDELDVHFATRTYLTRHGNGPMDQEVPSKFYEVVDQTNVPNNWQGSLRHSDLSTAATSVRMMLERGRHRNTPISTYFNIALSHCDKHFDPESVAEELIACTGFPISLSSWGPCRENVRKGLPHERQVLLYEAQE